LRQLKTMAPAKKERPMRIDESLPNSLGIPTPAPKKVVMSRTAFALVCCVCGGAGAFLIVAVFYFQPPSALSTPPTSSPSLSASQRPAYPMWPSGNLPVGEPARDFSLTEISSGREVRLSGFRGQKPVVLIFGNSRCGNLGEQAGPLENLYRANRDQAEFLFVYVDPRLPGYPRAPRDPWEEARQAMASLKLTIPCVLDNRFGDTEKRYRAWPQRLVIVAADGRIALDAGNGLRDGWDLAEVEAWLKQSEAP
jgi:hypothetical protein